MSNKIVALIWVCLVSIQMLNAQTKDPKDTEVWEPVPRVVSPAQNAAPPSDAIMLFDGSNLDHWTSEEGTASKWEIENGAMTVAPNSGNIITKDSFGDIQLHIEWRTPKDVVGEGQGRGNSGVFFQSIYELQVLDNYNNDTYSNGQAGSVYKQHIPLVNACLPPGEWQTYDVVFMAPQFNSDGILVRPATITAFQNGVLIQNNVQIMGPTTYIGLPKYKAHGPGPLLLQDHGNPVSYRNIWIREL